MNREKQIEEMAKVLDEFFKSELGVNFNDDILAKIAKHLYDADYRKQRVGAWVWKMKIEPQAQNRLYCSVCDEECLAKNNYYVKSNYCHNCGAKMKGF